MPALIYDTSAQESFRLPKQLLAEPIALATLILLVLNRPQRFALDLRSFLRHPAVVALGPLLAVASLGFLTSSHPLHVREGLTPLWIGAVCLVGWSLSLTVGDYRRILQAMLLPAGILALIAIGQFYHLIEPFQFEGVVRERIAITSWAGGVFDLAGYLVLPLLVAQVGLYRARGRWRWVWGLGIALGTYTMAITQTMSAIAALLVGSAVLWLILLPWRRTAGILGIVLVLGVGLAIGIEPLRERIVKKTGSLEGGDLNNLLSGRLDGWWTALWMFEQQPWTGVGHGAYRSEFGNARLALSEEGYRFYRRQHQPYFINAHSEVLEVLAEWGLLGALALVWSIWRLVLQLIHRRKADSAGEDSATGSRDDEDRGDRALMIAGVVALGIMAAVYFPLRLALVGYPYLLLLSWVLQAPATESGTRGSHRRLAWIVAALLAVVLVWVSYRGLGRMQASRKLVEVRQLGQMVRSPLPLSARRVLEGNAAQLRELQQLDPIEVRLPLSRGALYFLLGRYDAAIRAYEEALVLEPRSEVFANLGRARLANGDREGAREAFRKAQQLDRTVRRQYRPYFDELGISRRQSSPDD